MFPSGWQKPNYLNQVMPQQEAGVKRWNQLLNSGTLMQDTGVITSLKHQAKCLPPSSHLKKKKKRIYLKGREKEETEGEMFHLLVPFPNGCKGQDCARPKQGAWNFWVSIRMKGPRTGAILCHFPRCNSKKLDCKQSSWDLTDILMDYNHCR